MNSSLEPIPTKPAVVIDATQSSIRANGGHKAMNQYKTPESGGLMKAYPWLLATSVCLSGVLCWLYVTKPVMAPLHAAPGRDADVINIAENQVSQPTDNTAALLPSDTSLPGTEPGDQTSHDRNSDAPLSIDPRALAEMGGEDSDKGWESTNLKVQHILSADSGSGQLEKIILDVPVRYQTRTMRWTSHDIEQARNVLGRLMIYERDLHNLRKQGQTILKDWNTLLEHTVPAAALRADSPSIPYNHAERHDRGGLPDSSAVIKVDKAPVEPQQTPSQN